MDYKQVIDYNRGVVKNVHPSGVAVYMYVDTPGVFINAFGTEVTVELAKSSGFDTDPLLRKRAYNERVNEAMANIEAEMTSGEARREPVMERDGFKVLDIGLGRHDIEDPDGNKLNTLPMPLEQAELLFNQLAPKDGSPVEVSSSTPEPEDEVLPEDPDPMDEPEPVSEPEPKVTSLAKGKSDG